MNNVKTKISTILISFIFLVFMLNISIYAEKLKIIKERGFTVKFNETLTVDVSGAEVDVKSRDGNEVMVKILGNKKAEEKMNFRIEQNSAGIDIEIKKKGSSWFNLGSGYKLRVEVTVPHNYNADIKTSGGNIKLSNIQGSLNLRTSGGDVSLDNTNGKLLVKTSGGDIMLQNHIGESELTTSGGDIVTVKQTGDIKASTSGGDVELETLNGKIYAKTSGGNIKINYSGAYRGINVTTSGGGIKLNMPKDIKATVQLVTSGGSIDCNFSNIKPTKISRRNFEAELNGGGELFYAKTSGGNIYLREN